MLHNALRLAINTGEVFVQIVKRKSRYKIPNRDLAKILDKGLRTIERYRAEGIPDTKRISSVKKWIRERDKNKVKTLAEDLNISLHKCYEYLRYNMPKNNFVLAMQWKFAFESVQTFASLAKELGISRQRVRVLVQDEGMPFNESLFPVQDAREWIERQKMKKNQKLTNVQFCNILGISRYQFDEWVFKSPPLPTDNLKKAMIWMKYFTTKSGVKLQHKEFILPNWTKEEIGNDWKKETRFLFIKNTLDQYQKEISI